MRFVMLLGLPLLLAADWPRFLGPNGDGHTTEVKLRKTWPKEGPPEMWTKKLGIGYAPPSVADGKLFHFDRYGNDNRLTCRDVVSGKEIWHADYVTDYVDQYGFETGPRCCPVVDRDRVFVYGPEGILVAYAVKDGKELWRVDTRKEYHFIQNFFGVASTPWVEGDRLIVAIGGSPKGRPAEFSQVKPDGTALVAFDIATGKELWRCGKELASYASPMVATIKGQRVGLYFARGGLLGFDPANGKELFTYPWRARILESVNAANPVVMDDTILISESYEHGSALLQWDGQKIRELWTDLGKDRFEASMKAHWCTPIRHGGFVYGCSSRHSPEADLRCVELKTGDVKWVVKRTRWQTVIEVNDILLSLAESGEIRLFKPNPEKYDEIAKWDADLPHPAWAPPVVSNGFLFVRGRDKLVCYDLR